MGSDLLRRVRWSNVARVVAAVAVVAAIVAWPRLGPPRPRVPDRAARPLVTAPESGGEPRVAPTIAPRVTRAEPRVAPTIAPRVPRAEPRVTARPRRRVTRPRRRAPRARLTNPGIEEAEATGPVVGGGTSAPVGDGAASAPAPAASTTPARDPAGAEFGFER